jgi:hypothetical protein
MACRPARLSCPSRRRSGGVAWPSHWGSGRATEAGRSPPGAVPDGRADGQASIRRPLGGHCRPRLMLFVPCGAQAWQSLRTEVRLRCEGSEGKTVPGSAARVLGLQSSLSPRYRAGLPGA